MYVGLTGKISSGKSTISNYIREKYGFNVIGFRDLILQEIRRKGMEETRENMQCVGNYLYNELGPEEFCNQLISECNSKENYVIDSIRHLKIHLYLKRKEPNKYFLIFVDAPINVRLERLTRRDKNKFNFQALKKMESHQVESEIEDIRPNSDYAVFNNSCLRSLYNNVDKIMEKLL